MGKKSSEERETRSTIVEGVEKCSNLKIGKEILNEKVTFESKPEESES